MSVPVLSMSNVSDWASRSSAAASFTSTPACAPRPIAVTSETGVARPSAQGQAMISTAMALSSAWSKRGSGPTRAHATKVSAEAPSTNGVNQAATRSASRAIGASLSCAASTRRTICASNVSAPTRSATRTNEPVVFKVPALVRSPARLATGTGSPVSMDSSTSLPPLSIRPSTGTLSPGRTRNRSPGWTVSSATSSSRPSAANRCAVFGARFISARIAASVRAWARCSKICPSNTIVVMKAVASK